MPHDPLKLDQLLCFSLYSASMAVNRTYKPLLDELGITYPQYLVLNVLWESDGETIGAIAERLALESSTITPLVKRLEAAGLLTRERNPQDERQVLVRLTDQGRALQQRSVCLGEALFAAAGMPVDQLVALNRQVQAFRDALATYSPN
ncbi:MAG: MarR family transcriptional regulator [Sphingomonas sp.]